MTVADKMSEFLDAQMVLELVDFAQDHNLYSKEELAPLKLRALEATLRADEYAAAGGDSARVEEMHEKARNAKNAHSLYAAGQYEKALEQLRASDGNVWGEYAANIMAKKYSDAAALYPKLQDQIEVTASAATTTEASLALLNKRTWFVHWVLFSLFKVDGGLEKLSELFFQSQCITTIQVACPWILRYLTVAVVLTASSGHSPLHSKKFKELSKAIAQETYEYTDPVLDFILGLCVDYDNVETLGSKLTMAEKILSQDYFCKEFATQFATSGRALVVNFYVKTHDSINAVHLASALGISVQDVSVLLKNDSATSNSGNIYHIPHTVTTLTEQLREKIASIGVRATAALSQAQAKHEQPSTGKGSN